MKSNSSTHTLSEAAYAAIRQMVLSGDLPPGAKMPLESLAKQLEMGTTPLREALSRLAMEGLVVGQGHRGYRVAEVSRKEFEEITDLRLDLEPKALQLSIQNGDLAWEGRVVSAFHQLARATKLLAEQPDSPPLDWEAHNRAFHMTLIESCGNDWLLRFTNTLYDQSERYRQLSVAARAVALPKNEDEHEALMRAALDRDTDRAIDLLREHIGASAKAAREVLPEPAATVVKH